MAKSQPQGAFSALTHGLQNKWMYLSRVIPDISHLLLPVDDALRTNLIPAVSGWPAPNDLECDLFTLPAQHGGLGIRVPSEVAERELLSSQKTTCTLNDHILSQDSEYGYDIISHQQQEISNTRQDNWKKDQDEADRVYTQLPDRLPKVVALPSEQTQLPPGSLLYLWLNTASRFTSPHFMKLLHFGMAGSLPIYPNVDVEMVSVWNTPYPV